MKIKPEDVVIYNEDCDIGIVESMGWITDEECFRKAVKEGIHYYIMTRDYKSKRRRKNLAPTYIEIR